LKSALETAEVPPQTATFKNSPYNTAHFINSNFQPEVWTPESEELTKKKNQKNEVQEVVDEAEMIGDGVKKR
jgi:hypothetical protein